MHPSTFRVVHEHRPYLFVVGSNGEPACAYGPFDPGTEPSLEQCTPAHRVHDPGLIDALRTLLPRSPELPDNADTLARG